jgi:hypothetical protein
MIRKLPLSLLAVLVPLYASCQFDYNKVVPVSPTAAGLARYGEVPVSLYTGTPNISIPLGGLRGTELQLPIDLSYMARGVKVEEQASWVGLGWSLNCAGSLSRVVRGMKDGDRPRVSFPLPTTLVGLNTVMVNIQEDLLDTEPDLYYFNFNGHSGSFFFDQNGEAVIEGYQDIKVINGTGAIITIITGDGTQYIFGDTWETTEPGIPAAVNLTSIVSPTGRNTITFQYTNERYTYYSSKQKVRWVRPDGTGAPVIITSATGTTYPLNVIQARRLTGITTNFGQNVEFIPESTARPDFANPGNGIEPRMLSRIRFYDQSGATISNVKLTYEAITTSLPYAPDTGDPTTTQAAHMNVRMYLKSVQEFSGDMTATNPPYELTYYGRTAQNQDMLPHRVSPAQDYWGYFNGASNVDLSPSYNGPFGVYDPNFSVAVTCPIMFNEMVSRPSFTVIGANRSPSGDHMKYGTLSSIKYPTGGRTDFEFEPHRYVFTNSRGETATKPATVSTQAHVGGGSQILVARDTITAYMGATFEFELGVTCWDYTNNHAADCDDSGAQTNYQLHGNSSVTVKDLAGQEIISVKWLAQGFGIYRWGVSDPTIGVVQPDENGYISRSYNLTLPYGKYIVTATKDANSDRDIFGWLYYTTQVPVTSEDESDAPLAGGLRVKRIESYNEAGVSVGKKTYEYKEGVVPNAPLYSYVYSPGGIPRFVQSCIGQDGNLLHVSGDPYPYLQLGTEPAIALASAQGSPVGYGVVTEKQTGNGKRVLKFSKPNDLVSESDEYTRVKVLFYENTTYVCSDYAASSALCNSIITALRNGTTLTQSQLNAMQDFLTNNQCTEQTGTNFSRLDTYTFSKSAGWPYFEKKNYAWQSGHMVEETHFNEAGSVVYSKELNYKITEKKVIGGLRMQTLRPDREWQYSEYSLTTGTVNIDSTVEVINGGLTKVTRQFYDGALHNYLTKQTVRSSDGSVIESRMKYADDYTGITSSTHPITMRKSANLHMTASPIETREYRNGIAVGGAIVADSVFARTAGGNFVAPRHSYQLFTGVTPSSDWVSDPTVPDANLYYRVGTVSYDGTANQKLFFGKDGIRTFLLWLGTDPYPSAKVINPGPDLTRLFFKNFEDNGTAATSGNPARSGTRYLNSGSFNFSSNGFSPVNTTGLKMSYWYWNGTKWLYSGELAFSNSISAGSRLDDIRAYPAGAVMTTYTFLPFGMVGSVTDPNGSTESYSYDNMRRLQFVNDKDGNVIKKLGYHFIGSN